MFRLSCDESLRVIDVSDFDVPRFVILATKVPHMLRMYVNMYWSLCFATRVVMAISVVFVLLAVSGHGLAEKEF